MGGAIRFITPTPNLTAPSGALKADVAYTDGGEPSYELGAAYGAPLLNGTAGFRVSAWGQHTGGFIDRVDPFTGQVVENNINHSKTYVVRPAFTWAPTDSLSITSAFFMQHRHSANPDARWVNDLGAYNGNTGWGGIDQPLTEDLRLASIAIRYQFSGLQLNSYTSYLDRELQSHDDFTHFAEAALTGGNPFISGLDNFTSYANDISFTHAFMEELRLSSQTGSSRLGWTAGLFYRTALTGLSQAIPTVDPIAQALGQSHSDLIGGPDYIYNGQPLSAYTNFHTTDISEAIFADVNFSLTAHVKVDVGARIEHTVVEHQETFTAGPLNGVPPNQAYQPLLDDVENPVTPKVSITYRFTDDDMVYASASKGYRPGGGNTSLAVGNPDCNKSLKALGLSSVPPSFKSDKLWNYEIGTKDFFFDKRLSIDASLYYVDWSGIQTGVNLPSCYEGFQANLGKAISQGFDLQLAAIITQGLKVGAYVGYTHAYYPDAAYSASGEVLHAAGELLHGGVIPWTASANAEYSWSAAALSPDTHPYIRVDFRWIGAQPPTNPNNYSYDPDVFPNQAYSTLNLRLGAKHGDWDLSAYVNNVTHANPRIGWYHDLPGDPLYYVSTLQPFTVGLTGWYKF